MKKRDSDDIRLEFLARAAADMDAGRLLPLAHYQAAFPGCDDSIASEYARLSCAIKDLTDAGRASDPSQSTERCERLGRYRLERIVGRGGQGAVFEAFDEVVGRRVAVKTIDSNSRNPLSAEKLARFRREAESLSRLDHPGIDRRAHV